MIKAAIFDLDNTLVDFLYMKNQAIDSAISGMIASGLKVEKEQALQPYPNAEQTLIRISTVGLKLGLITDAPSREAWTRLYSVGLHDIFDRVVTSDETNTFKPSPEPFSLMLKHFNILPSEAIMVGDWPERDLDGASNVGMKTAFARYGASSLNKKQYNSADVVLESIEEIIDYIKLENSK